MPALWLDNWIAEGLRDIQNQTIWGTEGRPVTTIDVETRSLAELKVCGSWMYSRHPSTDVLVMSYNVGSIPGNTKRIYFPVPCEYDEIYTLYPSTQIPPELLAAIQAGHLIEAHNASFEIVAWHNIFGPRYGWPAIPLRQWRCSMAKAAHAALPLGLDMLTNKALPGLRITKDKAGHNLMLRMCKPQKKPTAKYPGTWIDSVQDRLHLGDYCDKDVESEMAASHALPDLPWFEWIVWALDMVINLRGAPIDAASAAAFTSVAKEAAVITSQRAISLTGGYVESADKTEKIKEWLATVGVHTASIAAEAVTELLSDKNLPAVAREMLEIRQGGALKSIEKCGTLLAYADVDGMVRGLFQYHGAATGRFAGRGPQPQNLPKGNFKEHQIDVWPAMVMRTARVGGLQALKLLSPRPLDLVKSSARGLFAAPPGFRFLVSDYNSVEARGLSWLAHSIKRINVFLTHGRIYALNAADIFGKTLDEIDEKGLERAIGKVCELAFGYAGGVGAWMNFGSKVDLSEGVSEQDLVWTWNNTQDEFWTDRELLEAGDVRGHYNRYKANEIKNQWRENNPEIADKKTGLWAIYERAAVNAVHTGQPQFAGRVWWFMEGDWLKARLPSGRDLHYYKPWVNDEPDLFGRIKPVLRFWGMKMRPGTTSKTWTVVETHGGKLAENINQAICRDIMTGNMPAVEAAGYPVVLHIHDELVAMRLLGEGSITELGDIMCRQLYWSEGLPLAAAGWEGPRYKKD